MAFSTIDGGKRSVFLLVTLLGTDSECRVGEGGEGALVNKNQFIQEGGLPGILSRYGELPSTLPPAPTAAARSILF